MRFKCLGSRCGGSIWPRARAITIVGSTRLPGGRLIATGFCDRCHVLTPDEIAELKQSDESTFSDALLNFIRKESDSR